MVCNNDNNNDVNDNNNNMYVTSFRWIATPATAENAVRSNKSYLSSFSNMFVKNAPESVLNTVAKGNVIKNQYGYVVPQLASYFLPIGE